MLARYFTIILCLYTSYHCNGDQNESYGSSDAALKFYKKLFNSKRKEHWDAIKAIKTHPKEKSDRILSMLVSGMLTVFKESKQVIENADFRPGAPFPDENSDETLKEALSRTLENAAFFADLSLYFPDMVKKMYKSDNDLKTLANWAITFSNSSNFYDGKTTKLMHLVGQELGLTDKEPDYVNPYSTKAQLERAFEEINPSLVNDKGKKPKKKQNKGPRLQKGTRSEL